ATSNTRKESGMHEPLNPEDLSQSASNVDFEHLEHRIVRALETVPRPQIPADFAARVASQFPASRPVSLTPRHYGQYAMLIGTVVTLGPWWASSCTLPT